MVRTTKKGVLVRIFNRWGNLVYENERYRNYTDALGMEMMRQTGCISTASCCPMAMKIHRYGEHLPFPLRPAPVAKVKTRYVCSECGHAHPQWVGNARSANLGTRLKRNR